MKTIRSWLDNQRAWISCNIFKREAIVYLVNEISAVETSVQKPRLFPLYFLSFCGDFLLSTMIVASTLAAKSRGAPDWIVGILGSAFYMSYTPCALILGRLGDKMPRRACIGITATGCLGVSIMLVIGWGNVAILFIGELLVGFFNGFYWPSIEAFISENSANETEHQANVNKFCLGWSIGYMIGPFIAPVLDDIGPVYSFLIMTAISCVNLANVWFLFPKKSLKLSHAAIPAVQSSDQQNEPRVFVIVLILALAIFTYNFARAFIVGVFPDIAKSPQYYGWTGFETGSVLFCFGAARSVMFLLQNRIKNKKLFVPVILSFCLSASSFLFTTTRDFSLYCIFFAVVGIFSALVYSATLQKMLHIPAGRGQAAGLFESGLALGGLVSPIFSGFALGMFRSPEAAFIIVGTVSTIVSLAALILFFVSRKTHDISTC
ncbi:MAG TPA: MFS transporter [Candidatus Lokiarchaeia archaeon]|nr:MFS transporter [Candidatus Lokiarchaeia archaeon]